jgi:hypothetical protein
MARKRTVLRSRSGKKLYAVRDEKGVFVDIQSYQRAHAADLRQTSKSEQEAAAKKSSAKKAAKKKPAKKKPAKKAKPKAAKKKPAKRK